MIDEISYYKDPESNEIKKIVLREEVLLHAENELTALKAQLADFEQGEKVEASEFGPAAIANYREQILILEALEKGK